MKSDNIVFKIEQEIILIYSLFYSMKTLGPDQLRFFEEIKPRLIRLSELIHSQFSDIQMNDIIWYENNDKEDAIIREVLDKLLSYAQMKK